MEKDILRNTELRICEIPETERGLPFGLWFRDIKDYGMNWPLVSRE